MEIWVNGSFLLSHWHRDADNNIQTWIHQLVLCMPSCDTFQSIKTKIPFFPFQEKTSLLLYLSKWPTEWRIPYVVGMLPIVQVMLLIEKRFHAMSDDVKKTCSLRKILMWKRNDRNEKKNDIVVRNKSKKSFDPLIISKKILVQTCISIEFAQKYFTSFSKDFFIQWKFSTFFNYCNDGCNGR